MHLLPVASPCRIQLILLQHLLVVMERLPSSSDHTQRNTQPDFPAVTPSPNSTTFHSIPRPSSFQNQSAAAPGVPRLRRNSTFTNRPLSVPPGGLHPNPTTHVPRLRRGSSFLNQSFDSVPDSAGTQEPPPHPHPRLRRGSSFVSQSSTDSSNLNIAQTNALPRLRRGSSFVSQSPADSPALKPAYGNARKSDAHLPQLRRGVTARPSGLSPGTNATFASPVTTPVPNGPSGATGRSSRLSSSALPRAGTFAYGSPSKAAPNTALTPSSASSVSSAAITPIRRASSTDKMVREKLTCGMCSSCCGEGISGMPPWAPERLKLLSEDERRLVLEGMRMKEEIGRIEAELREKRVQDMVTVERRLESRRTRKNLTAEANLGDTSGDASEDAKVTSEGTPVGSEDLESVDLGDEPKRLRSQGGRSQGGRSQGGRRRPDLKDAEDDPVQDDDLVAPVDRIRGQKQLDDCGFCEKYEQKVVDLEHQLDVLREVVKLCSFNEEASKKEQEEMQRSLKKNKSWMDKIANAYYGHSASADERSRLKEEVEVLRKATDYLFQKLQVSGVDLQK